MSYNRLPVNATAARQFLNNALNQNDLTLLLIIGDDQTARNAQEYAAQLSELSDYSSVAFIEVPNPAVIMSILESLPNPRVSLDNLDECVALSISPRKDILSYRVSKSQFNHARGYIKTAILRAFAIA